MFEEDQRRDTLNLSALEMNTASIAFKVEHL